LKSEFLAGPTHLNPARGFGKTCADPPYDLGLNEELADECKRQETAYTSSKAQVRPFLRARFLEALKPLRFMVER